MKVLVACECSGRVKMAFRAKGHNAWSCDILPSEIENDRYHIQDDVLKHLNDGWDLMIAHPPCIYLCVSGARWLTNNPERLELQKQALSFVQQIANAPIDKIAIENPIGKLSRVWRKPDQVIQPFWFGEPLMKSTCLWLKNLPKLKPANIVPVEFHISSTGRKWSKWFWDTSLLPYEERSRERSRTFWGIANAMADQWGDKIEHGTKVQR